MDATPASPRALLVFKSVHHHNTEQIARAIAGVLGAELATPAECPYERLDGVQLLGVGSGVYYGRPHPELLAWVHGLPDGFARGLPVFLFTTSGLPFLAPFWHWSLKHALAKKGCRWVGAFACRGFDTWGPLWLTGGLNKKHPDERDLARARAFADRLVRMSA